MMLSRCKKMMAGCRIGPFIITEHAPKSGSGCIRRRIMTVSVEPPPASTVPERPCEVVLAQDSSLYPSCWQEPFSQILPQECGIHFCSVSIDSGSLQGGLDILRQDLATLSNVVLVARGPLVSLLGQYYLESLPLAGLVMVDPILISHVGPLQKIKYSLQPHSLQHEFVERILTCQEDRPLKLEPRAVPLLIFRTINDPMFQEAADDVALYHGDGEIPVHDISSTEQDALDTIERIAEWIDESVL